MTTDALLTTAAVCALLGVQRNALARYRAAGLPFVVLAPGAYRYRRADLDAWLERRTIVAKEMAGHSSITTTINTYATQAEEARKKAATAMDEALRREAK